MENLTLRISRTTTDFFDIMARTLFNEARIVRELTVASSFKEAEKQDRLAWARMSPWQRIATIELLRQMNHADYDPDTARLPRLLDVVKSKTR